MRQVKNVTLMAISSIEINETINSLIKCSEKLEFDSVKLVSHEKPNNLPSFIEYDYFPRINNIMDFNNFCWKDLHKFFDTSHVLTVQSHAWILRPELWEDSWLDFDWIGAPWKYCNDSYITHYGEHVRQGNGGFTLRSKKISEMPTKYNLPLNHERGFYNEDGNFCVYYRKIFLDLGIKYAPVEVAAKFSYEQSIPENENVLPFGFHKFIK